MVFREVSVIEIREVLRAWLAGKSELHCPGFGRDSVFPAC